MTPHDALDSARPEPVEGPLFAFVPNAHPPEKAELGVAVGEIDASLGR